MSGSHAIPPCVGPEAASLLERAYALRSPEESLALYQDWARSYDATMLDGLSYVSPALLSDLLARSLADRRALTLDVGCGTGLAGLEMARRGYSRLHGLDVSPDMRAAAEARGIYASLLDADLGKPLPFPDASYDAILCTGTFTHGHVGAGCLAELARVLRPGGLLACTVHRDVWSAMGFDSAFDALEREGRLRRVLAQPGIYYATSTAPDGYFLIHAKADIGEAD